jgi:hypothetical protein
MESDDGTIIEVFEWKSPGAIEEAHTNEKVQKMWREYEQVCDYVTLSYLKEAGEAFAAFHPFKFPLMLVPPN